MKKDATITQEKKSEVVIIDLTNFKVIDIKGDEVDAKESIITIANYLFNVAQDIAFDEYARELYKRQYVELEKKDFEQFKQLLINAKPAAYIKIALMKRIPDLKF